MARKLKAAVRPNRAWFAPVKLSSEHQRQWDETLAACNWVGPGFVHIMYSMLVPKGRTMAGLFTEQLPLPAATDGYQLIFNPDRFFALSLMKRVFVVFHLIMHNIFDHCGASYRAGQRGYVQWEDLQVPYFAPLAHMLQDLIINDTLVEARMGEKDRAWLHDPNVASFRNSWAARYIEIWRDSNLKLVTGTMRGAFKMPPSKDVLDDDKEQPVEGQMDLHLDPGVGGTTDQDKDDERQPRSEIEWQQAVAAGMAVAKAQGKLPSALELVFGEVLEPAVTWKDHIRALMMRRTGAGGYNWQRPDRRLIVRNIVAPGRTGHGAKLIIIGGDNSGSMYGDLDRILSEVKGILEEINPEKIIVIWCDAEVHEVDEVSEPADIVAIQKRGTTGGGGTNFVPVFQHIEDEHWMPDVAVYITDMMGTFPAEPPPYPVIWATISDPDHHPAPFGDLVYVPPHAPKKERR